MNRPAQIKGAGRCEINGHKRRECSLIFRGIASDNSRWYWCVASKAQAALLTSEPEADRVPVISTAVSQVARLFESRYAFAFCGTPLGILKNIGYQN